MTAVYFLFMQNRDHLFVLQQRIERLEQELELLCIQVHSFTQPHSTASLPKPTFNYIAGSDNKLADALSRVPTADALASVEKSSGSVGPTPDLKGEYFCIENNDPSLLECMLHHPDPAMIPFPLDYGLLAQ
jgi:hypothetical protein